MNILNKNLSLTDAYCRLLNTENIGPIPDARQDYSEIGVALSMTAKIFIHEIN